MTSSVLQQMAGLKYLESDLLFKTITLSTPFIRTCCNCNLMYDGDVKLQYSLIKVKRSQKILKGYVEQSSKHKPNHDFCNQFASKTMSVLQLHTICDISEPARKEPSQTVYHILTQNIIGYLTEDVGGQSQPPTVWDLQRPLLRASFSAAIQTKTCA